LTKVRIIGRVRDDVGSEAEREDVDELVVEEGL
jgi:hypothetical protein